MRSITGRIILLIVAAAIVPLVLFGAIAVRSLREGTQTSVREGNLNVARRAAEQIGLYATDSVEVLRAIAAEVSGTKLEPWQQDRVVKNFVLQFPEFREISLFEENGAIAATSRIGPPRLKPPSGAGADVRVAPITIDDDLLPTTTIAVRMPSTAATRGGWMVGELSLEELWRTVDRIRVGREGYALLMSSDGRLVAHGDPNEKKYIARGELLPEHNFASALREGRAEFEEYTDQDGKRKLATGALVPSFGWAVIVEQPLSEAYAIALRLERQLMLGIAAALLLTLIVGFTWGREFVRRIFALRRGTEAIAAGRLTTRVEVGGRDEIRQLGDAFNWMADRLVELRENLRRQERQATFGRVAAGLVHDLSHPIQNIANSCRLLFRSWDDLEFRSEFERTIDRESESVKEVLEDLKNIARPIPVERSPVDVNAIVRDVAAAMRPSAAEAGLTLAVRTPPDATIINGNAYALGRIYRNLLQNAIQATAPGGRVAIESDQHGGRVYIRVTDTGTGIAPERLHMIFDDYVTTKKRGLGLGLAISRRLAEELGGTISVESEVGIGTTFTLEFPALAGARAN